MPRYFFDTDDTGILLRDECGMMLDDRQAARLEAIAAAHSMARDGGACAEWTSMMCRVRDEGGRVIYCASVTFVGRWENDQERKSPARMGSAGPAGDTPNGRG